MKFWSDAAEARFAEHVDDALDDFEAFRAWVQMGKDMVRDCHVSDVTLCDSGTMEDIAGIIRDLEPHSPEQVALKAREVAIELENL